MRVKSYSMTFFRFFLFYLIIMIGISAPGCDKDDPIWDGVDVFENFDEEIFRYHNISKEYPTFEKSGNQKVYIDFSDGMIQAYKNNSSNAAIIQAVTNKLIGDEIEWYSLGNSSINKLDYPSTQLFNKVTDPAQYKDIMAPIEHALDLITTSKNDAILVTDFEEYTSDGKEQFENYPKKYLVDWLKSGNTVTFYYTNFKETNRKSGITTDKKLYFAVFTYGKSDRKSLKMLFEDALKGRHDLKKFEIGGYPFNVVNDYGGANQTGLAVEVVKQSVTRNINALVDSGRHFEVIELGALWSDFGEYLIEDKEKPLIQKLFIDAKDKSYYSLNKVKVAVSDITGDYENYGRYNFLKKINIGFVKDEGNNDVWDDTTKANQFVQLCFDQNTSAIKTNYQYSYSTSPSVIKEFLKFDEKVFLDHLRNTPEKIELRTLIHENFSESTLKNEFRLLKIELLFDEMEFNYSNPQLKDFEWYSSTQKGRVNNSLSEAVRNALQHPDVHPGKTPIYTYYIKTY